MCCFFFFKQKTAYEMRISDWSSDVCSSDLNGDFFAMECRRDLYRDGRHQVGAFIEDVEQRADEEEDQDDGDRCQNGPVEGAAGLFRRVEGAPESGSASCRESGG